MKTIHYLFSSVLILLCSCKQADAVNAETDFSFSEPQPINDSKINSFPKSIVGNYINSDSTYLIVTDKRLIYKWIRKHNTSFKEFEEIKDSCKIVGKRLYHLNEFCEYRTLKDSVEITSFVYDTIFTISENQTAKRIKSSIVLNTKDSIYWKIRVLNFNKDKLTFKILASFNDLDRIDSLSKVKVRKIDSTRNIIQLSRKEFKNMLKLKNFGYNQDFNKID